MKISEIIEELEINNLEKNKLLMCLLRNTDEFHEGLKDKFLRTYELPTNICISKIVNLIIHAKPTIEDESLVNYLVISLKSVKHLFIHEY